MIVFLLLTHYNENGELQLSDKMIDSINNQMDDNFRVVLAINNCKTIGLVPNIKNLDKIIYLRSNNIALARNELLKYFVHHYSIYDYCYNLDGDDELLLNASYILNSNTDEEIYYVNFLDGNNLVINIDDTTLGRNYKYSSYLIRKDVILTYSLFYYENEKSCEDLIFGLRIGNLFHSISVIFNPVQKYLCRGNSKVLPDQGVLLSYLQYNINFKIKKIIING